MEKIWIDAAEFESYGGFLLETQFVREMGEAYLMANGVGEAVEPAGTTFFTAEEGYYRVHVRTKNWLCEYNPDGLVIEIDGIRSKHICAEAHIKDWYFEIGGDFLLQKGKHTLKIYDTLGWFARFASVVITNDYDFTPSKEIGMLMRQRAEIKHLDPTVKSMGDYELIVVGGGVGGVVTAITAARYGLKTALLNDRPVLGGNASDEANVTLEGAAHRGYHETGVVFELKAYRHNHEKTWSEVFEAFCAQEKNLDVFSNTLLIDATTNSNRIREILTVNTLNLQKNRFSAPLFVDATGDGWLGYYAGALYRIGREAKFQHNESFAPDIADGNTMSGCATAKRVEKDLTDATVCSFLAEKTDAPVSFKAPAWAFQLPAGNALGRTPTKMDRGEWWLEMPNDYDDLFEGEFVRDSMIRMSLGYFDWLKNSWSDQEKAACYRLKKLGTYNAKRETRRLIGDYLLTENDFTENKAFPDAVTYCGWKIDVHHPSGIFSGKKGAFTANKKIPISPIPFGALYSKNIDNLMMVGRCISVTHLGLGPVRVQLTIGTMGQAVATAAYLCKKRSTTPRCIRADHIDELQQLLLRDGMTIPGVKNHDRNDLALQASASATSFAENGKPQNVINGKIWANDGKDYAWISDAALPQSIELKFEAPKKVREVRITFDIPFSEYRYGYMEQPSASRMVTDFTLSVLTENGWIDSHRITDNRDRLVVLEMEPTVTSAIKITVCKTLREAIAVIPEIRIYE
jgi:hypothetical protein